MSSSLVLLKTRRVRGSMHIKSVESSSVLRLVWRLGERDANSGVVQKSESEMAQTAKGGTGASSADTGRSIHEALGVKRRGSPLTEDETQFLSSRIQEQRPTGLNAF
ncbi:hypothetical protein TNCV_3253731 [Trichonephila clavipes]|nr:hypothetical protein TNCV_3253731 [Trichonephila clavipes]